MCKFQYQLKIVNNLDHHLSRSNAQAYNFEIYNTGQNILSKRKEIKLKWTSQKALISAFA